MHITYERHGVIEAISTDTLISSTPVLVWDSGSLPSWALRQTCTICSSIASLWQFTTSGRFHISTEFKRQRMEALAHDGHKLLLRERSWVMGRVPRALPSYSAQHANHCAKERDTSQAGTHCHLASQLQRCRLQHLPPADQRVTCGPHIERLFARFLSPLFAIAPPAEQ